MESDLYDLINEFRTKMVPPIFFRMQKRKSLTGAVKLNKTALIGRNVSYSGQGLSKLPGLTKSSFGCGHLNFFLYLKFEKYKVET